MITGLTHILMMIKHSSSAFNCQELAVLSGLRQGYAELGLVLQQDIKVVAVNRAKVMAGWYIIYL